MIMITCMRLALVLALALAPSLCTVYHIKKGSESSAEPFFPHLKRQQLKSEVWWAPLNMFKIILTDFIC